MGRPHRRRSLTVTALVMAIGAIAPPALRGHADVLPTSVPQGVATEFTLRVPTERDLPTTAVRIMFPEAITVYSLAAAPPGFTLKAIEAADGGLAGAVYTGTIPVRGYQDFTFLGTPFGSGRTVWKVFQTYADGKVKPWTGPPEDPGAASNETGPTDPGPASPVEITASGAATATATASPADSESGAGVWLGLIGVVLGLVALGAVGLLWSSLPGRASPRSTDDADATSR